MCPAIASHGTSLSCSLRHPAWTVPCGSAQGKGASTNATANHKLFSRTEKLTTHTDPQQDCVFKGLVVKYWELPSRQKTSGTPSVLISNQPWAGPRDCWIATLRNPTPFPTFVLNMGSSSKEGALLISTQTLNVFQSGGKSTALSFLEHSYSPACRTPSTSHCAFLYLLTGTMIGPQEEQGRIVHLLC